MSASKLKKKPLASSVLMKEMQRLIAISALEKVYSLKSMSMQNIQKKLQELYHGLDNDDNHTSFVELCLDGKMQFSYMWELEDITVNAAINVDNDSGETLCLKRSFSRIENGRLTAKLSFTRQSLTWATRSGPTRITGRTLLHLANKALANLKKANAHALCFFGPDGQLPSGTTEDDLDEYVLGKMFVDLNGNTTILDESDQGDDDDEEFDATVRTDEWFFHGWFAFKCFGPMAPENYQSPLIALGDIKGKDIGRSSCRSEAMKEKLGLPRDAGNNKLEVNNKRSTTPTNVAHKDKDMAIIAQAEDAASQRHKETNCVVLTALVQSTITEVAQNLEMLKLYTVGSDEFNEILQEIKDLRIKLKSYKDELHNGNEKRKTPDQVTSYFGNSKMNKINDDNFD
jgi:hypothetical protein